MAKNYITRSRLFTPSVVRRIVNSSEKIKDQTAAHLSGSAIGTDRSFKFDAPGTGLKSTQQLNLDWSRFENHTFFNSAEAKVNTAFDMVINNYPFDGSKTEIEDFFDKLTGFEKYVFDEFPKCTGALHFNNSYIITQDRAGASFPSLSDLAAKPVLDPEEESLSVEMHIYIPVGSEGAMWDGGPLFDESEKYNKNQVICQKLDVFGQTGFTMAVLDSRLKNRNEQLYDANGISIWTDGATQATPDNFQVHNSLGQKLWTYTVLGTTKPASEHYKLDGTGDLFADDTEIDADLSGDFVPFMHTEHTIKDDPAYAPVRSEVDYGKDYCDISFLVSSGSTAYLSASMEIPKGKWNHICASYDRTYGENNVKLYLDSKLITTSERSYRMANLGTAIDEDDLPPGYEPRSFHVAPLMIGSGTTHFKGTWGIIDDAAWSNPLTRYNPDGTPATIPSEVFDIKGISRTALAPSGSTFSGSLDEFRIWHAPRNQAVLKSLADRNVFSGANDSLRLCYRFNEPKGQFDSNEVVLDSGGESLHAKIVNYDPGDETTSGHRGLTLFPPEDGRFGDPEDPLVSPMKYEKENLSPILFPSHPDVIALNGRLLDEAAWYDTNNPNLITKLIPPHYLMEAQAMEGLDELLGGTGDEYTGQQGMSVPGAGNLGQPHLIASLLFTWARYFDEMKMFLDHFANVLHVDYETNETVADTFLPFVANYYGFDLPKVFSDAAIPQYMEGENITPDQSISDLSLQFVQNQIWRRVLTNMNEIIQSKGTRHGIKALLAAVGINPDKLFRFREYGGSRTQDLRDIRRNRTEISAVLDFNTTLENSANNARGYGNILAGFYPLGGASDDGTGTVERNPWEGVIGDVVDGGDNLTDLSQVNWIKPMMISPFLSGSRGEIGPVEPDTNIPKASVQIEIDFSLTPTPTAHYETRLLLLDSSILDRKIIELEDLDGNTFKFQIMIDDQEQLDSEEYIRVDIDGILDRVEIAEKFVEVINENSTFEAYNVSEENNGKIKIIQPRGGRAGNLPIKMWQHINGKLEEFTGEHQLITEGLTGPIAPGSDGPTTSIGETLWCRRDILTGEVTQLTDLNGKLLWRGQPSNAAVPYDVDGAGGIDVDDYIIGVARGGSLSSFPFHGFEFDDSPSSGAGMVTWQTAIDNSWATVDEAHAAGVFDFSTGRGASADEKIAADPNFEPAYAIPLSALGYNPTPQVQAPDDDGNMINVWKSIETGEVFLATELIEKYDDVVEENDIPATYERYLTEETEEQYATKHGYHPITYSKRFVDVINPDTGLRDKFSGGELGFLRYDHPDVSSEDEKYFIQENGTFHGFDFTPSDGLFTSGSWTAEATYRFDKPTMTMYPVTQSLFRIQSTADASENHVLLTNLVAMRHVTIDPNTGIEEITNNGKLKLFVRPGWDSADNELELCIEDINLFNGQLWHVSFGRDRADQYKSEVSSSYFLRAGRNHRGELKEYYEDRKLFQETLLDEKTTFWSNIGDEGTGKNEWGPFIVVGSQDLPDDTTVGNVGLNSANPNEEKMCTHFSGRIAQLRFWSKGLTEKESKEHMRNPFSIGVEEPGKNFNFAFTASGSYERLRMDVSFDQPVTGSTEDELADQLMVAIGKTPLGFIELFDFSQSTVTGSRGAIWRKPDETDQMHYHMIGYGFNASGPGEPDVGVIYPERFDFTTIDAKFDEHGVDNKIRVRGYQETKNIEEFQTDMSPVYEILKSESPNDDTRFSIDVSAFQGLNDDIVKIFATLDALDNMIGAPELVFATGYPDLNSLREVYFNRLTGKVNIRSFFEFFKWFDSAVGTMIEKLIPRKTHFLGVNFVIESHMLERAKLTYNYSDTYLGSKNRHGLKGTITLQQYVGQVKRF